MWQLLKVLLTLTGDCLRYSYNGLTTFQLITERRAGLSAIAELLVVDSAITCFHNLVHNPFSTQLTLAMIC